MSNKASELPSELHKSLLNFKSKLGPINKDATNPYFKSAYATLDNIIEVIEPILTECGLVLTQPIVTRDGKSFVVSEITDGINVSYSELPIQLLPDPQKLGSLITYYRRYTLCSLLGLKIGDDDDGNSSFGKPNSKAPALAPKEYKFSPLEEIKFGPAKGVQVAIAVEKNKGGFIKWVTGCLQKESNKPDTDKWKDTNIKRYEAWLSFAKGEE